MGVQLSGSEPLEDPPLDDPPLEDEEPPLDDPPLEDEEPPLEEEEPPLDDELPVLPDEPPEDDVVSSSPSAAASPSGDVGVVSLPVESGEEVDVVVVAQATAPAEARATAKRREARMTRGSTPRGCRSSPAGCTLAP